MPSTTRRRSAGASAQGDHLASEVGQAGPDDDPLGHHQTARGQLRSQVRHDADLRLLLERPLERLHHHGLQRGGTGVLPGGRIRVDEGADAGLEAERRHRQPCHLDRALVHVQQRVARGSGPEPRGQRQHQRREGAAARVQHLDRCAEARPRGVDGGLQPLEDAGGAHEVDDGPRGVAGSERHPAGQSEGIELRAVARVLPDAGEFREQRVQRVGGVVQFARPGGAVEQDRAGRFQPSARSAVRHGRRISVRRLPLRAPRPAVRPGRT